MKLTSLIIVLMATSFSVLGDPIGVRSVRELRKMLRACHDDTLRLEILHEIGKTYLFRRGEEKKDLDSAELFFADALRVSTRIGVERGFGKYETLQRLGEVYFQRGQHEAGKEYFMTVIRNYEEDVHSMFVWSLTLPGVILGVVLHSNSSLLDQFTKMETVVIFSAFVVQALCAFLHRVYNGSDIDHLIFKQSQLDFQRTYLNVNDHLLVFEDVPDLSNKIASLHYIKALNTDALGSLDQNTNLIERMVKIFETGVMVSMVIYFILLVYFVCY